MTNGLRMSRGIWIAIGVSSFIFAVVLLPSRGVVEGADRWAQRLPASNIPVLLSPNSLATLPVAYRRALFRELNSSQERAQFWLNVFASYRQRTSLSAAQEEVLTTVEALLTPKTFEFGQRTEVIASAMKAVADTLGTAAQRELFLNAGPDPVRFDALGRGESLAYLWRRDVLPWTTGVLAALSPAASASTNACQCSVGAYGAGEDENCKELYPQLQSLHL